MACALGIACVAGCAALRPGVAVESRPTPPQPAMTAAAPDSATPPPVEKPAPTVSEGTRKSLLRHVTADTTAVGEAVRQCAGRHLLPDQEGVVDATLELLEETRAALAHDDLVRAGSLARRARQLATSLNCP